MFNNDIFNTVVSRTGFKKSFIIAKLGISSSAFYQKCTNRTKFSRKEEQFLKGLLNFESDEEFERTFHAEDFE